MFKVLIIEDLNEKALSVKNAIQEHYSELDLVIDIVDNIRLAKLSISKELYDLCILDINLPLRKGEESKKDAGNRFLDEIHDMDNIYKIPKSIIGLTSYEDIFQASVESFNGYLSNLIFYENSSNVWFDQIKKLIDKILVISSSAEPVSRNNVICIVNALDFPELDAVLSLDWQWEEYNVPADPTQYYRCKVDSKSGEEWIIYTAASEHMGMPSITALAMKMINNFTPRYIGITGISAGTRGEVNLGDVIVADPSWDWGSGKYIIKDDKSVFKPAPYQLALSPELRNKFRAMQRSVDFISRVQEDWKEKVPEGGFQIHIGPVASGASVLADQKSIEMVKEQHRKMLGIEMEAFGVFSAAYNACIPQPLPFSIKSVCDYADETKADDFHSYAAYTSAMTLKELVEQYI